MCERVSESGCMQPKGLYLNKLQRQIKSATHHVCVAVGRKKLVQCRVVLHAGAVQNTLRICKSNERHSRVQNQTEYRLVDLSALVIIDNTNAQSQYSMPAERCAISACAYPAFWSTDYEYCEYAHTASSRHVHSPSPPLGTVCPRV